MATFKVRSLPTLDDEKRSRIKAIRQEAKRLLAETDWMVIRRVEKNVPVPDAVKVWRDRVRKLVDQAESDIQNLTTVEAVRAYQVAWPPLPDVY